MWDWELQKNGSGKHTYNKLAQYSDENFHYAHVISNGSSEDVFCLHNHAMYELVYMIRGDVMYLVEGEKYHLQPPCILIIGPTVLHKLFICSDEPFERHTLYIYYSGNDSPMSSLMAKCQPPIGHERIGSMYYQGKNVCPLKDYLQLLAGTCREEDEMLRELVPVFAQAFIAKLLMITRKSSPEKYSKGTSSTVDTMLAYLNQSFTREITLQDVANRFFITRDYCNRVFKKATGMTVMQYVIYNRVLYAKQLLIDGISAAQAAEMAGFSDYSNFFRSYRNITGRAPSEDHKLSSGMLEIPDYVRKGL